MPSSSRKNKSQLGATSHELRALNVFHFQAHLARTDPENKLLGVLETIDPGLAYTRAMVEMVQDAEPVEIAIQARRWPAPWNRGTHGHFGKFLNSQYKNWVADWRLSNKGAEQEAKTIQEEKDAQTSLRQDNKVEEQLHDQQQWKATVAGQEDPSPDLVHDQWNAISNLGETPGAPDCFRFGEAATGRTETVQTSLSCWLLEIYVLLALSSILLGMYLDRLLLL